MAGDGREFDVVVLGATGFTGRLTAEYLARQGDSGTRWAVAGRNKGKLAALRDELGVDVPIVHADSDDLGSLRDLAGRTRVVATTVGPYLVYGERLVQACAELGTDYVDLTGEPEFVDLMYLRHHDTAVRSGARIVHACGFDSIPHDLGAYFTVRQLPEGVPLRVEGYVRASGRISGGTLHSALTAFGRGRQMAVIGKRRRRAEHAGDRDARAVAGRPRLDRALGGWVLPLPTIDPQVVRRSAAALERYGPSFRYSHYAVLPNLLTTVGVVGGVGVLFAGAQLPVTRRWLLSRLPAGEGPSAKQREDSWFSVRFVGEGGGRRVVTEVSGGDPGYGETAKMLAESALCLAHDDLPPTAGQVTTAPAMGDALIARLQKAGIAFTVLESSEG
ncbi:MAG TPA: saccharopine dehydrogenase NADP-binding domain-containing protein [Pseudonocardiaceae bacterium]